MPNGVVFRRIGGRIVPIHEKRDERVKAGTTAGVGMWIGHVAGKQAAKFTHEAALARHAAYDHTMKRHKVMTEGIKHGGLFEHAAVNKAKKIAVHEAKSIAIANKLDKAAFRTRAMGTGVAAAMVTHGVNRALNTTRLKEDKESRAAISGTAGAAAGFAVYHGYLRGVGMRGRKAASKAIKRAVFKL